MLAGFLLTWLAFFGVYKTLPYLSSGAEVVFRSKLTAEYGGKVFPAAGAALRVMIFGNSQVLSGFVPEAFDTLALKHGLHVTSFNSGYPAREEYVIQLVAMLKHGTHPDLVLLTLPWRPGDSHFDPFDPIRDDHGLAERLFPFRYLLRDAFSFLLTSQAHGGPLAYYRQSRANVTRMLDDRGYYFIVEQSHFPHDRLPADFSLPSDTPDRVLGRNADPAAGELRVLDEALRRYNVRCLFVPQYFRASRLAPPPAVNEHFRDVVRSHTSCDVVGPDYLRLDNQDFSDEGHANPQGALAYTRALFDLIAPHLAQRAP